jgi:hypothetical protein
MANNFPITKKSVGYYLLGAYYFYNRNRIQLGYIQTHLFRLKEAFDTYSQKLR